MGFYLRKSISVGPFRFNLSSGGVGVSVGIRGLRIGSGPRGNYVHMGRGGLYYRATLPPAKDSPSPARPQPLINDPPIPAGTHAPLEDIESADIGQIVDSSSKELLEELNSKRKRARLRPWVVIGAVSVLVVGLLNTWPGWLLGFGLVLGAVATYAAHARDALAKTVVMFYEFDTDLEHAYGQFHTSAEQLLTSAAAWHVASRGAVHDSKYHAGASSLVERKATKVKRMSPPYVQTNVETIAIGVGRQTLHFFPDRVLVYDVNGVGAVSYGQLRLLVEPTRFIEDSSPPSDATVVGQTWRYVNKSGGPDRRFNNNTQLPICLYDEMSLSSASGLNEVVQFSKAGVAKTFAQGLAALSAAIPKEFEPMRSARPRTVVAD